MSTLAQVKANKETVHTLVNGISLSMVPIYKKYNIDCNKLEEAIIKISNNNNGNISIATVMQALSFLIIAIRQGEVVGELAKDLDTVMDYAVIAGQVEGRGGCSAYGPI